MGDAVVKQEAMMIAFQDTFFALKAMGASRRPLVFADKTKRPVCLALSSFLILTQILPVTLERGIGTTQFVVIHDNFNKSEAENQSVIEDCLVPVEVRMEIKHGNETVHDLKSNK